MRVAYLVNQYPTVSHTFIRREIQELERHGHRIARYSIRESREPLVDPLDRAESDRTVILLRFSACILSTIHLAITRPVRFWRALRTIVALWRNAGGCAVRHLAYLAEACHLVLRLDPEIAHLHAHFGTNSTSVALLSYVLGGPKYSFTAHGPEEFDRPEAESLALKIANAAFVVAVSSFGKAQLQRWCRPEDCSKLHVVRCGIGEDFFSRPAVQIPDTRRLVCVGRLSPQKGLLTLIDAAERLARRSVAFDLTIIGEGPLRGELEKRIAAAALQDRVRLVGAQTQQQVQSCLEASLCLVLPSFAEGLPVVIMEAFALSRPVISTYVAGIPELVVDGQNGWLIPAGSEEDLAAAIARALATPIAELQKMGLHGRERVRELHSSAKEASKLAKLFASPD